MVPKFAKQLADYCSFSHALKIRCIVINICLFYYDVIGGTSMLPGFRHRLMMELREIVRNDEGGVYEKLKECEFRVHNPPTHANLVSWLGASILASLQDFHKKFITKEYYHQVSIRYIQLHSQLCIG